MKSSFSRAVDAALRTTLSICITASVLTPASLAQSSRSHAVAAVAPTSSTVGVLGAVAPKFNAEDSGALAVVGPQGKVTGKCPLKHTSVSTQIAGYVARVTVKQVFANPFKDKIEAVYTFPLSETGAVDDMVMKVGKRTIHGLIKRKEEARKIYDDAKNSGRVASLLDQERPNIFTQSVANIKPGESVEITLQYVDLLPYDGGAFTFAFPTVVGPRFNPGTPTGKSGLGFSPDTTAVPDGSKITPPVTAKGTRAGHDIDIQVSIDGGVPIDRIESKLHEVNVERNGGNRAVISLKNKETIPNKDFVLTWQVAGDKIKSGYLTHRAGGNGYFTMMLLPPKRVTPENVAPKEMVFLIDCSGSQSGAPLDKAKETLDYIVDNMNPNDTFQIISFSDRQKILFDKPHEASASMREQAHKFIGSLSANGGTWMAPAVEKACSIPADGNRLRIVTFMTDGYVGNDFEILGMVKKLRGKSRWFPFGTGNSVNRFLIDGIAREGGGEPDYVLLNSPGQAVAKKFYDRISSPVLTDVKLDFGGLAVKEVFPHELSDVWAERPLYIKGRYLTPGKGVVTLSGFAGGKPYVQKLDVTLPDGQSDNAVLGSIWARAKVDRLMSEDWMGAQRGEVNKELKEEVIKVALDHHIMTQYTSFVAVEEKVISDGGKPRTVAVPVEMPDGVSYEGVFGEREEKRQVKQMLRTRQGGYGGGSGGGGGGGGPVRGMMLASPAPLMNGPAMHSQSQHGKAVEMSVVPAVPPPASADKSKDEGDLVSDKKDPAGKLSANLKTLLAGGKHGAGQKADGIDIRDGKVLVQIWLVDGADATLKKLKELGFEMLLSPTARHIVIGRIDTAKLEQLSRLDVVRYIETPNK